jgi:hypothetical protein
MRKLARSGLESIQQQSRKPGPHRASNVILEIVTHTQNGPRRQTQVVAGRTEE